ncbi:MAG: LytTR family DNA-binding domain-containing protein [Flectobacillus sp.]|jgi:DNA-binding LytR/AlgR family response regulator|nr:LytTR family DNA-binding domain-containing protein [Flectobacillus sp.]
MITFKCLLIEDDKIVQDMVSNYAEQLAHIEFIETVPKALDALPILHSHTIDILFLNLETNDLNGFDLIKMLEARPQTIVLSSSSDMTLDAFELGVVDYLVKPFTFERFVKAISRASEQIKLRRSVSKIQKNTDFKEVVFLKSGRELLKFMVDDIVYIEAMGGYTKVYTNEKSTVISESISDLQSKFSETNFLRVHKSYLVPVRKIIGISARHILLEKAKIPLGISYRDNINKIVDKIVA